MILPKVYYGQRIRILRRRKFLSHLIKRNLNKLRLPKTGAYFIANKRIDAARWHLLNNTRKAFWQKWDASATKFPLLLKARERVDQLRPPMRNGELVEPAIREYQTSRHKFSPFGGRYHQPPWPMFRDCAHSIYDATKDERRFYEAGSCRKFPLCTDEDAHLRLPIQKIMITSNDFMDEITHYTSNFTMFGIFL